MTAATTTKPSRGFFKGVRDAKIYGSGNPLGIGLYELEITACIDKDLLGGGKAFIVEFKVLKSTNPAHPVGTRASWFQSLKLHEVAFPAIKLFMFAALGKDARRDAAEIEKDILPNIEALLDASCAEGALDGYRVKCEVWNKKTKTDNDFSVHTFSPYESSTSA